MGIGALGVGALGTWFMRRPIVKRLFFTGEFPTLSKPGEGLPKWTRSNRSIENEDIVLWYTMAMQRMVRAENWPVMPILWHSFELRPFDFFDRNPALDLPKR